MRLLYRVLSKENISMKYLSILLLINMLCLCMFGCAVKNNGVNVIKSTISAVKVVGEIADHNEIETAELYYGEEIFTQPIPDNTDSNEYYPIPIYYVSNHGDDVISQHVSDISGTYEYYCISDGYEYKRGQKISVKIYVKNISGSDMEYLKNCGIEMLSNGIHVLPIDYHVVNAAVEDKPIIFKNGQTLVFSCVAFIIPEYIPSGEYSLRIDLTGENYGKYTAIIENVIKVID